MAWVRDTLPSPEWGNRARDSAEQYGFLGRASNALPAAEAISSIDRSIYSSRYLPVKARSKRDAPVQLLCQERALRADW